MEIVEKITVITLNNKEAVALAKILAKTSHDERIEDGIDEATSLAMTELYKSLPDTGWGK